MPRQTRPLTLSRAGIAGTIGAFVVALLCARLGFWQLDRLEQKRQRNAAAHTRAAEPPVRLGSAQRDTAGMIFRHAIISGTYDDERTIIIAGRSFQGVPGVYVVTPLRIGGSAVLINRGFTPSADAAHVDLANLREPSPDSLEGLIVYLGHDENTVSDNTAFKRIWHRPSIAQLRAQVPYPLASYIVQLLPSEDSPPSPMRLPSPELDEGPHFGYAIQWFSFAAIFIIGWGVIVFRMKRTATLVLLIAALAPSQARGQLRPLDPIDFQSFGGSPVRFQIGGGAYLDQHAALAGTRGTLWEVADFRATVRTGRVVIDLGGTVQRFFHDKEIVDPPFGDASPPPTDGKRHDAGDYRVGAIVRLTPDQSATLATLRFGTRLPTTDNRVGLDRDAIDFFATLAAHRVFSPLALAVEAGLGINGTREPTYEQADVLVYAATAEMDFRHVKPFLIVLGQQDFQEFPIRGNEDLSELRAGFRIGSERWINVAWVHGFTEYSPSNGVQLSLGMSFGGE